MKAKCGRCEYVWDYTGKSKWYMTCPRCYTKIRVTKLTSKKK
jgi:hypothetical protein